MRSRVHGHFGENTNEMPDGKDNTKGREKQMDEMIFCKAEIKNTPTDRFIHGFMVVRVVDCEMWYYGVYGGRKKAMQAAKEIGNGVVFEV